jgi:GxxExxY protein
MRKGGVNVAEIVYKEESFAIIGACFEVYNEMGCGFLEAVYQECLAIEFPLRKIPFVAQRELMLRYKGETLDSTYKPDFICHERIIVELKAVTDVTDKHRAQVHNYLKATGYRLGLLVNFGQHPKLQYERIVR